MQKYISSAYETNTYCLISEKNNAVIIDPAEIDMGVIRELNEKGAVIRKILLTHGHFDHTKSCAEIVRMTGAKVFVHASDEAKLADIDLAMGSKLDKKNFEPILKYQVVTEGDIIEIDEFRFYVMHTPGHTAGSVIYRFKDILFTGDTIFKETIGATNDRSSDLQALFNSVERIKALDCDFQILPGHGPETTLYYEKKNNFYFTNNWLIVD